MHYTLTLLDLALVVDDSLILCLNACILLLLALLFVCSEALDLSHVALIVSSEVLPMISLAKPQLAVNRIRFFPLALLNFLLLTLVDLGKLFLLKA